MSNNNGGTICNYLIIESKFKLKDYPFNDDDGELMVRIEPFAS